MSSAPGVAPVAVAPAAFGPPPAAPPPPRILAAPARPQTMPTPPVQRAFAPPPPIEFKVVATQPQVVYVHPAPTTPYPTVTTATMPPTPSTEPAAFSYRRLANGVIMVTPTSGTSAVIPEIQTVAAQEPAAPRAESPTPAITQQVPARQEPRVTDPPSDTDTETLGDYGIEVKPPPLFRLFRLESEAELKRRIVDEFARRPQRPGQDPDKVEFPTYEPLTDQQFETRTFGGLVKMIEPNYVCHWRLYAEELNAERYGWTLGPIQPIISGTNALKDFALLPYNFATRPCQRFECSAGKCYPGDPVPYLIYPIELSATGAAWQVGVIAAGFALIP